MSTTAAEFVKTAFASIDLWCEANLDEDGNLVIDRAGVREYLNGLTGYSGLIGTINCDDFGDCGSQKITVIDHQDSGDIEASKAAVVFEYAP